MPDYPYILKPNSLRDFRDTRISKAIMAQTLKESYAELFKVHASPYSASDEDLENFFRTETGRGGRMLQLRSTHLKFCAILQTSKSHLLHRHHFLQLNKLRHQP